MGSVEGLEPALVLGLAPEQESGLASVWDLGEEEVQSRSW